MVTQSFSFFAKLAQRCITESVSKVKALTQEGPSGEFESIYERMRNK